MTHTHNVILFSYKEEQNYAICRKMDGTGDNHAKQNKTDSEKQVLHVFCHYVESRGEKDMKVEGRLPGKRKWIRSEGGIREGNGGEFDQITSYACIETSQ
jgi:hypothetical protein